MKRTGLYKQAERLSSLFLVLCLVAGSFTFARDISAAQAEAGCATIYNTGSGGVFNGWIIELCTSDPNVPATMQVVLDGVSRGSAALVRIYHEAGSGPGIPQVAVFYASGFVRLKQNADPGPAIPFGASFILGPGYWSGSVYYHNPVLTRLEIDTSRLPGGPLLLQAQGTNQDFQVSYDMLMPPPTDFQTRLHVEQTHTAAANFTIDAVRRTQKEGLKLVQVSSMFINEGAACDGGYVDCHDSNAVRYIASDLARHEAHFSAPTAPGFLFASPPALGSTWLDVLHTDDQGWQSGGATSGNTPNVRIALDDLPGSATVTPQGRIEARTDPRDTDNVNVWLHDDSAAASTWTNGESGTVSYWLLAQDDPPDPWADHGLRPGPTFLDFEGSYTCFPVKDAGQATTVSVAPIAGYSGTALQLNYALGSANGNWAQVRCDFSPPLNLSAYDHLRFEWRGDPNAANSLEIGVIDSSGYIFGRGYHHPTQRAWWGQMVIPFRFLSPWTPGTQFNPARVSAIFVSVVKDPVDDAGGSGSLAIDNLGAFNAAARSVPAGFESTALGRRPEAQAAADWLASQQQSTGLVKSWLEEGACVSHTYDQALALIVFAGHGMWAEANALAAGLVSAQNADGSWPKSRDCTNLAAVDGTKWEGDIAWAIYALSRYRAIGGADPQAAASIQKGAGWLATRIHPADGCLVIDHTEGTIDAWWAFQSAGPSFADEAQKIRTCLLTHYWDNQMGRFKGGRDWWQPYLDNQTWGAAFLKAIGETDNARRALSYAWSVLRVPARGGQLIGFDGQAGPWSVWNEGTGQYLAVGGAGSFALLPELLAQQESDGSLPGSPDEFNGGGVWTTRWHGVAPTAWLYFALCGGPFSPGSGFSCSLFSDVSADHWARSWIERLYEAGITGGCGVNPLRYCPEGTVTRAQMAVFLLRGIHGSAYMPPVVGAGSGFGDVPATHWAAPFIKQLAVEGITAGCGNGNYCPEAPVNRAQMAVFLLRSKYGAGYVPPAVGAGTGFGDVPATHWAAPFIKQLVTEGITVGCGAGNYCPEAPVSRAQMAVFLVRTFNLP